MTAEPPVNEPVAAYAPAPAARARAPRLVTAGVVATAVGAAGVGASIPALLSDADATAVGAACGSALVVLVGAGLIQRGRATRPNGAGPVVADLEVVDAGAGEIGRPAVDTPTVARSPEGPEHGDTVADRYRLWVLGRALDQRDVPPLDVVGSHREVFELSAAGVALLLSWLYDRERTTYTVDRWVDEILPGQGVRIDDRDLAVAVLTYAALRTSGVRTEPPTAKRSDETAHAMATVHVGLLRLYCGIGPAPVWISAGSIPTGDFVGTPSSSLSTGVALACHTPA